MFSKLIIISASSYHSLTLFFAIQSGPLINVFQPLPSLASWFFFTEILPSKIHRKNLYNSYRDSCCICLKMASGYANIFASKRRIYRRSLDTYTCNSCGLSCANECGLVPLCNSRLSRPSRVAERYLETAKLQVDTHTQRLQMKRQQRLITSVTTGSFVEWAHSHGVYEVNFNFKYDTTDFLNMC